MSEWKQLTQMGEMQLHRNGWWGVWDALVSAITNKPRITVNQPVTFSAWVKCDKEVRLEIAQGQVETGEENT